jgi:hypothetical protein
VIATRNETDGSIHQLWYEDPQSLGAKYQMASKLGLRGVGFYCASGSWPDRILGTRAEDAAMCAFSDRFWTDFGRNIEAFGCVCMASHIEHTAALLPNLLPISDHLTAISVWYKIAAK